MRRPPILCPNRMESAAAALEPTPAAAQRRSLQVATLAWPVHLAHVSHAMLIETHCFLFIQV